MQATTVVREIVKLEVKKGKLIEVPTGTFEADWRSPDGNWGGTSGACATEALAQEALKELTAWGEGRLAQGLN